MTLLKWQSCLVNRCIERHVAVIGDLLIPNEKAVSVHINAASLKQLIDEGMYHPIHGRYLYGESRRPLSAQGQIQFQRIS